MQVAVVTAAESSFEHFIGIINDSFLSNISIPPDHSAGY